MVDNRQWTAIAVIAEQELPLVVHRHDVIRLGRFAAYPQRMCGRRPALVCGPSQPASSEWLFFAAEQVTSARRISRC